MNIFTDFHHQGLLNSLYMLFEKRLGHKVYRQIGLDWHEKGFWKIYDHPDTAKQYLMDGFIPKDGTPPLNGISRLENGIHIIKDEHHHSENRAITFEQFCEMDIDIVIASIPDHIKPFKELIAKYKPKAKFIFQQGNMFGLDLNEIPNLLSSTIKMPVPSSCNAVFYHQEMNLEVFKPSSQKPERLLSSFVNLLPSTEWGTQFYEMKCELPEYEFLTHGILCDNGIISGIENIAHIMNRSMWGVHLKKRGDGFGHVLFSWYAVGRPVITHISDYIDKLGGELLIDGETCIDLDRRSVVNACKMIRDMGIMEHEYMCQQSYQKFKNCVDYDKEEKEIRKFIDNLH